MRFGDKWSPDPNELQVVDRNEKPERTDPQSFTPPACTNTAVLITAIVGFFVLTYSVFALSGGEETGVSAKAVVFMFEGFKGTAFEKAVLQDNKAPNLKRVLQNTQGKVSHCISTQDARCALTQSGFRQGGNFAWDSAPGIASILSGVNSNKHRVYNDSYDAMTQFSDTSKRYPTFLKVAKDAGLRTAVVGSSHLLTGSNSAEVNCKAFGVLDFECGISSVIKCTQESTCNAAKRISFSTSDEEAALPELKTIIKEGEADLIVVHIPTLAIVGASAEGEFDAANHRYAAQIYLLDAYVGQVLATLEARVKETREAWLVVGSGDHGGYKNTFGKTAEEDEVVPFFVTAVMADGNLNMNALSLPTKQFDVAPTVLRWLDALDEDLASSMDGRIQGICSNGKQPIGCDEAALLKAAAAKAAAATEESDSVAK